MGSPVPGAGRPLDPAGNRGARQMTVPGASAPGTESGLWAAPAVSFTRLRRVKKYGREFCPT